MKKLFFIVGWIILIFTPVAGISSLIDHDLGLIDYFISKEWAHVIGHLAIFFCLGTLLSWALKGRPYWVQLMVSFLVIILAGLGQEAIQLIFKNRSFGYPEIFDLFVDLGGGFTGMVFYQASVHILARIKQFFNPQEQIQAPPQENPAHNLHQ